MARPCALCANRCTQISRALLQLAENQAFSARSIIEATDRRREASERDFPRNFGDFPDSPYWSAAVIVRPCCEQARWLHRPHRVHGSNTRPLRSSLAIFSLDALAHIAASLGQQVRVGLKPAWLNGRACLVIGVVYKKHRWKARSDR